MGFIRAGNQRAMGLCCVGSGRGLSKAIPLELDPKTVEIYGLRMSGTSHA